MVWPGARRDGGDDRGVASGARGGGGSMPVWRVVNGAIVGVCSRLGRRAVRVSERASDGLVERGALDARRDAGERSERTCKMCGRPDFNPGRVRALSVD